MAEQMLVDLRTLMVEKEDCDAGTVQQLRNGLSQGNQQFKNLREVIQLLKKKAESANGVQQKKFQLKLGIAQFFLGHTKEAAENLNLGESSLAHFYHGKALASLQNHDEAIKAFEKAEKLGYTPSQVQLQKASVSRLKGNFSQAKSLLAKLEDLSSHSAEFHFQKACILLEEGETMPALKHLERAIELDPTHTNALFYLAKANDLAGNDDEAISLYERCLKHPPIHAGTLTNLGVLYEDNNRFDKAVECYRTVLNSDPRDEQSRSFMKDAQAAQNMVMSYDESRDGGRLDLVLETPVTDFELSVRSRNCLRKMNIRTLGDLTRVSEPQLLASKNFGETSLVEIREMLNVKGLRIGQSLEDPTQREPAFRQPQNLTEQELAMMGRPASELQLSVRARKCMTRLGINTIGELIQRTADELLESRNFGMTSLSEVREKLQIMGLSLRGD
ncbi:MAG: tetratricopeptide repeat protein [Gemmataceae bacterium]|nr:tetratricopeptide repeat protein [Gemmataceae bacterium]